jgi:hypothetical protein
MKSRGKPKKPEEQPALVPFRPPYTSDVATSGTYKKSLRVEKPMSWSEQALARRRYAELFVSPALLSV